MRTPMVLAILGSLTLTSPAAAQKTEDEARLIFTMGLTYTNGSDLWTVQDQPILAPDIGFDLLDLSRSISGSVGVLFSGMYFPKQKVGFAGEVFFMGVGIEDRCATASPNPDPRSQEVCSSINGSSKSSSAVLLTVGPVLRMGADQPISPYIRAQGGLLFSNLSPVSMSGNVIIDGEQLVVVVYDDPSSTRITPGFVFGGGLTAVLGKGWQLRTEVRDNLVQIATVSGPTAPGIDAPTIVNEWKNLWSIVIGADVVLEKKRGRRY